ncbi:MAG TPA: hypothetical protein VNV86_02785, partial [Candidatus Acidoferrum sp.]|nr:hypothetical protein [Candidatus Acidoferrum sp.]
MTMFRRVPCGSVLCLTLAAWLAPAVAQENNEKKPVERKAAPHERGTPQQREPRKEERAPVQQREPRKEAPAQVQQHSAPLVQQHQDNQPQRQIQHQQQAPPQVNQARPVQENHPQQQANPSNGRTFGNPPNRGTPPDSGGRTFGNQPGGRPAEAPRTPAMNARPLPQQRNYTTRTGDVIHRDGGGHVTQVRMSNGTTVYHPQNGPRRVEVVRPDGRVVVAGGTGHGYVQRQVVVQNTTIIKRTYIYNGVPQARIYRPRIYGGITLAVYTPVRYYRPAFYMYAYNPWAVPVVYSWGWAGRPRYGYYGGYFTPYPTYASPSLWLTDYLIAATLQSAYEERMAARAAAAN